MFRYEKNLAGALALAVACVAWPAGAPEAQDLPAFLRDRGTGVATSMLGTYVRRGELLVYPFVEWYADSDFEYKPSELGYGLAVDYRGRYRALERLLFLGYGVTPDLALEVEAAWIDATLDKSSDDPSATPSRMRESGLGDVEAQVRWRLRRESERRPELFAYWETVFPLQKQRGLIGTRDWEFKLGIGAARGFRWGTATVRLSGEYVREERKLDAGEYAFEYLKQVSPTWRVAAMIEGDQVDEVALVTEVQWRLARRAVLKINNGWGLTQNATDFAPEAGLLLSF